MSLVAPHGMFIFRGQPRVRRVGFVFEVRRLVCPDGHRLRGFELLREDGTLPCVHKATQGTGECGALISILVVRGLASHRRIYAIDVNYAEVQHFDANAYTPEQVLYYCGAAFPGQEMPA